MIILLTILAIIYGVGFSVFFGFFWALGGSFWKAVPDALYCAVIWPYLAWDMRK